MQEIINMTDFDATQPDPLPEGVKPIVYNDIREGDTIYIKQVDGWCTAKVGKQDARPLVVEYDGDWESFYDSGTGCHAFDLTDVLGFTR
jgi:hypothetical protein